MSQDWVTETLFDRIGLRTQYRRGRVLHEGHTGRQHIILFEHEFFGRVLMLDGATQLTTADEFIYHEMMAHVPILAHGAARDVLIVGGGDGGLAREVLRHASVASLTQVEIDRGVVDFSLRHLPEVSAGAYDDPRLELVIADGADFVAGAGARFDVVMVDSTDPVGPGAVLFTAAFYRAVHGALRPGGILVTQNGCPFAQGGELAASLAAFGASFKRAACYLATVPTYVMGPLAFGFATDAEARLAPDLGALQARFGAAALATRYYTPHVHLGAFALPGHIEQIVAAGAAR
jgi:spermidine synthase